MNNNQFRRLVFDKPDNKNDDAAKATQTAAPSAFGAKKSSFMPMTPRTVKGSSDVDFARQVRERNAAFQPTKKFKTTAPKGVKYGAGYTDRAKARAEQEDAVGEDDKEGRIKALEEQMKLGQISEETFEAQRDAITAGDISSTHLVKGLDRRLLERVRRGEDVLKTGADGETAEQPPDVDDELDKLEEKEIEVVKKEQVQKKGNMAAPSAVAGVKRSRDEIMAELKAQRKAAAEAKAAPALDNRWRKVGEERNRIQIDHKGREVVIAVDEDGVVKKKVRRVPKTEPDEKKATLDMPDESRPVLGSDAVMPEPQQADAVQEESSDDDIFEGVGTAYNPLGDDDDDEEESSEGEDDHPPQKDKAVPKQSTNQAEQPSRPSHDEAPDDTEKPIPRNYFNDTQSAAEETSQDRMTGVQELLKKAAKMDGVVASADDTNNAIDGEVRDARLKKRAQMLANQDRDLDDMDMGFGSSRYDDGEDEDGRKVKLSEWKSAGLDGDDEKNGGAREGGDGAKKKRKPKKRKGDANNIADIMGVIEKRKSEK